MARTGLAYYEWSAPYEIDEVAEYADDEAVWRMANPAMGIRINEEFVRTERRAMDLRTFAVERLGVGDWPSDEEAEGDDRVGSGGWSSATTSRLWSTRSA